MEQNNVETNTSFKWVKVLTKIKRFKGEIEWKLRDWVTFYIEDDRWSVYLIKGSFQAFTSQVWKEVKFDQVWETNNYVSEWLTWSKIDLMSSGVLNLQLTNNYWNSYWKMLFAKLIEIT